MLVICETSPVGCDIAKHIQSLANLAVQARFAQCQAAQNASMYGGLRLRGGAISQCLEDEANKGNTRSEAPKTCKGGAFSLRLPKKRSSAIARLEGITQCVPF